MVVKDQNDVSTTSMFSGTSFLERIDTVCEGLGNDSLKLSIPAHFRTVFILNLQTFI